MLYVLECVMTTWGVVICCFCLYKANVNFIAYSTGLPSPLAKLEYFLSNPSRIFRLNDLFGNTLIILLVALSFAATRTCAFKCLVLALGFFVYLFVGLQDYARSGGVFQSLCIAQHREARLILGRLDGSSRQSV